MKSVWYSITDIAVTAQLSALSTLYKRLEREEKIRKSPHPIRLLLQNND